MSGEGVEMGGRRVNDGSVLTSMLAVDVAAQRVPSSVTSIQSISKRKTRNTTNHLQRAAKTKCKASQ